MASGINATMRQVGVEPGVAGLGTILVSHVRDSVVTGLDHTAIAGHAQQLARAISTGGAPQAIASAPAVRGLVAGTARSALVGGLNTILLIAAIVSFAAAVASFLLIRERDFVSGEEDGEVAVAA